jgi:regulator of sigma E protease
MDFLIKAAQLLLSLSILVVLHEFGHFLPARLFKIRVEKFYLFFNPWFSVIKKKIGDTEWGIGWLPLGGYVKISGMVDESMDTEQLAQPPQPWEFRAKPAWQRLIVMLGGVIVNMLLGIFIYICVVFAYGEQVLETADLTAGIATHPYLEKYHITSGDKIISLDGETVSHALDANNEIMLRGKREVEVMHADGNKELVTLPEDVDYEFFEKGAFPIFGLRIEGVVVDSVSANSFALKAGLQNGDQIIEANGQSITYFDELQRSLYKAKSAEVDLKVLRGTDTILMNSQVTKTGTLGFDLQRTKTVDADKIKTVHYGFGESISIGVGKGYNTLNDYASQLKFIFTQKGASSIGGFGAIGSMFPATWDWHVFWLNTALISIILAFMNLLPIPALDGGHVVFLLYEIVTGKEAPQKVLEYAQYAGFILLMSLMVYANGNDIYKWISAI